VRLFPGQNAAGRNKGALPADSKGPNDHGGMLSKFLIANFLAALYLLYPVLLRGQSEVDEYRLKAAFLFHFAQFVEWPSSVLKNPPGPLVICVMGQDPFRGELEGLVQGKSIDGRVLEVRHVRQIQDSRTCHLLFIGKKESAHVPELIAILRNMPVLTIGESDDFLQQGGIIRFCWEERKVRFEVNQEAAGKANLKISSRLLLLAKTVIGHSSGR